ncbi:MAG: LytTR family DNA-binding domain-containing protein [Clostridia bacterium]|nr:LytTR family DNA-binding domain-containing protein [Clostridia bacterium]MDE6355757.1 LytTR family DNA-binding domain-containing protein [Clostridia bacterium]MDE7214861.1 LytTR family DNA-binding domain-containing protein [Clostridia bacterium]
MIRIAIVEDEPAASEALKSMIKKFGAEHAPSADFEVAEFSDAETFLHNFREYEVIFLDIQMGGMSGMDAAREIRKRNEEVLIVFVTNMAQYAVESYEVEAYDFILKPLSYGNFFMKFRRILKKIAHSSNEDFCTLTTRFETRKVKIKDIVYVESCNHNLIFHVVGGEEVRITGNTLSKWESKLEPYYFIRCNSGFLVNLKYVSAVRGEYVETDGQQLHISRSRRQSFMAAFAKYVGGSV